jgi:hypothetical protein
MSEHSERGEPNSERGEPNSTRARERSERINKHCAVRECGSSPHGEELA